MITISRQTPTYYFTAVTHHRLGIFRTGNLKEVLCRAFAEVCNNHQILILAYVVMPDHFHALIYSEKEMREALRLINGVSARRIIQYLQDNDYRESLFKLRGEIRDRNHKHSVWQHHSDTLDIFAEHTFRQKLDYIHLNPVRAGFVQNPLDYRFSSARIWADCPVADEPLKIDRLAVEWRKKAA